jgi:hypothetical protein
MAQWRKRPFHPHHARPDYREAHPPGLNRPDGYRAGTITTAQPGAANAVEGVAMTLVRRRTELTRGESLRLLGSIPFGRIVFTSRALPAIQPVPHLLADQQIIIRASMGAAISSTVHGTGTIVAYQADLIDPAERTGWSVVVVGQACRVADEVLAARYRKSLRPWIDEAMDDVIAIDADLVTGFRIVPVPAAEPAFPATADAGFRQPEVIRR